jgi:hypothetical protein
MSILTRLLYITFLGLALEAGGSLFAASVCGLTVHVLSGEKPASFSRVRLVAPDGTVVRDDEVRGGEDRICDFGPGPHTLIVGEERCFPTTITDVRLDLDRPLEFSVRLNWCREGMVTANLCRLLLRVADSLGRPIRDATATLPKRDPVMTDDYGRALIVALSEPKETLIITKPGFSPLNVEFSCMKLGTLEEKRVILTRAPEGTR